MRLNLTIARNRLEPINVLWTTSDARTPAHTVSRLLADVNERFPLEADDWGLEDYVVSVNGFECLHYANVGETLRDGDHVSITPLESTDIRSRTLSGRQQISAAGISLIDGMPFGKPALRSVDRPRVHIPPRKRRRLAYDDDDASRQSSNREGTSVSLSDIDRDEEQLLLLNSGEVSLIEEDSVMLPRSAGRGRKSVSFNDTMDRNETLAGAGDLDDEEDDEEDEEDFIPEDSSGSSDESSDEEDSVDDADRGRPGSTPGKPLIERTKGQSVSNAKPIPKSKIQRAKAQSPAVSFDSLSEEFDSEDAVGSDSTSTTSEESSSTDSASETDNTPIQPSKARAAPKPAHVSTRQDTQSVSGSMNKALKPTSAQAQANLLEENSFVAPGDGKSRTKARNERRRLASRLQKLKAAGELPEDASINELRAMKPGEQDVSSKRPRDKGLSIEPASTNLPTLAAADVTTEPAAADKADQEITNTQVAEATAPSLKEWIEQPLSKKAAQDADFQARRQKLLDSLASGSIFANDNEAPEEMTSKRKETSDTANGTPEAGVEPSPKRARLDLNASRRMIFGNLGQRVPKTRAEAELTRQNLAGTAQATPKLKKTADIPTPAPVDSVAPESQAWRSKLIVKAVECVQDGVTLSEPPYPFVQRWDPQQKLPKNNGKSNKRKSADKEYYENGEADTSYYEEDTYMGEDQPLDEVDENGYDHEHDAELDYDERDNLPSATQAFQDQAEEQLIEEFQTSVNAFEADDDLIPLPPMEELSTLPDASQSEMIPGTVFAFKEFEVSAATGWRPAESPYRVAEVVKEDAVDAGAVALRLAPQYRRDADAYYDEDGKRIYKGWEMPMGETEYGEDHDTGDRLLNFEELLGCKILQRAKSPVSSSQFPSDKVQEVEVVVPVEDSMPIAQPEAEPELNFISIEAPLKPQFTPRSVKSSKKKAKSSSIGPASVSDNTSEWNGIDGASDSGRLSATPSSVVRKTIVEVVIPKKKD